jgi:MFS family permease
MSALSHIKQLPTIVKRMALSVFLFILWRWLGADIFFGIYIEQIIDKIWIVWLLWAVLAAAKLSLSIPIAYINDKTNPKKLLTLSKIMYIIAWLCYFGAGILHSPLLIIIAVVLNGFASPILFTTNMNIIRAQTDSQEATHAFALFHTAFQWAFFIGAIIIAPFVDHIQLPYVFLGIVLFSFISMIINITMPIEEEKGLWKTIDTYILHNNIYKKVRKDLKEYNITLYITLFLQFLYGVIDYIGFLFIPILWITNNLSLGQIAIIFAVMRIPHLLAIYFADIFDKYNKFIVVCGTYISIWIVVWWLAFVHNFWGILWLSLLVAAWLSVTRPIILWFIGQLVQSRHKAEITGVQETFTRTWEIVWSIWFALVAQYSSIQRWFFIIWILFILIAIGILLQQKLFILPKISFATAVKNTIFNIFETFEHYIRKK